MIFFSISTYILLASYRQISENWAPLHSHSRSMATNARHIHVETLYIMYASSHACCTASVTAIVIVPFCCFRITYCFERRKWEKELQKEMRQHDVRAILWNFEFVAMKNWMWHNCKCFNCVLKCEVYRIVTADGHRLPEKGVGCWYDAHAIECVIDLRLLRVISKQTCAY